MIYFYFYFSLSKKKIVYFISSSFLHKIIAEFSVEDLRSFFSLDKVNG